MQHQYLTKLKKKNNHELVPSEMHELMPNLLI